MNIELKIAFIRKYGSQIKAAKQLRIDDSKLSKLVHGHELPNAKERERLARELGHDYFAANIQRKGLKKSVSNSDIT